MKTLRNRLYTTPLQVRLNINVIYNNIYNTLILHVYTYILDKLK